jgi:hypothetical protein
MKKHCGFAALMAFGSVILAPTGGAELPALSEKPWLGYFAAFESRKFEFGMSAQGKGLIIPMGKSGERINQLLHLPIQVIVEEVLPSGATTAKQLQIDTLETKDKPSDDFEKLSFTGKTTGDASIEVHLEVERGVVSIGGRMIDKGTLTRNPVRFALRVGVPSVYRYDKKDDKAFEKKVEDDEVLITFLDGKRVKQSGFEECDAKSKEVNGEGISSLKLLFGGYQGKELFFEASEGSRIELWNRHAQPLYEGFSINWYPDPEKDPEAKSRLSFEAK